VKYARANLASFLTHKAFEGLLKVMPFFFVGFFWSVECIALHNTNAFVNQYSEIFITC